MSERLTSEEIIGLAQASPIFSSLLKTAAETFNEDVPATGNAPAGPNDGSSGYPSNSAPAGVVPPGGTDGEEDEYAAVPEDGEQQVEEAPVADTPEAVGARAAQAFLGPIMEGAMQGDANAQSIVAKAAGSVAGSVAESYAKSQATPGMAPGMSPGVAPEEMAPPAVSTPEEDIANEIVQEPAPVQTPPPNGEAKPPAGGVNGEEEEVDENGKPKKKKPPFPPKK